MNTRAPHTHLIMHLYLLFQPFTKRFHHISTRKMVHSSTRHNQMMQCMITSRAPHTHLVISLYPCVPTLQKMQRDYMYGPDIKHRPPFVQQLLTRRTFQQNELTGLIKGNLKSNPLPPPKRKRKKKKKERKENKKNELKQIKNKKRKKKNGT